MKTSQEEVEAVKAELRAHGATLPPNASLSLAVEIFLAYVSSVLAGLETVLSLKAGTITQADAEALAKHYGFPLNGGYEEVVRENILARLEEVRSLAKFADN